MKEYHLIEAAYDHADWSLETVEHILRYFRDVVLIARSSMTWDLIPYGQVSIISWLFLIARHFLAKTKFISRPPFVASLFKVVGLEGGIAGCAKRGGKAASGDRPHRGEGSQALLALSRSQSPSK